MFGNFCWANFRECFCWYMGEVSLYNRWVRSIYSHCFAARWHTWPMSIFAHLASQWIAITSLRFYSTFYRANRPPYVFASPKIEQIYSCVLSRALFNPRWKWLQNKSASWFFLWKWRNSYLRGFSFWLWGDFGRNAISVNLHLFRTYWKVPNFAWRWQWWGACCLKALTDWPLNQPP